MVKKYPSHLPLNCAHNNFGHKQFISKEKMQKKNWVKFFFVMNRALCLQEIVIAYKMARTS